MTTQQQHAFPLGTWVRSAPVGNARAFTGEVISRLQDGEYIIRDADRRRWFRLADELEHIKETA